LSALIAVAMVMQPRSPVDYLAAVQHVELSAEQAERDQEKASRVVTAETRHRAAEG